MAGNFSLLAQSMVQAAGRRFNTGEPRSGSASPPALPGFARGTLGVTGSNPLGAPRDVDAGENKERSIIQDRVKEARSKVPFTSRRIRALQAAGRF